MGELWGVFHVIFTKEYNRNISRAHCTSLGLNELTFPVPVLCIKGHEFGHHCACRYPDTQSIVLWVPPGLPRRPDQPPVYTLWARMSALHLVLGAVISSQSFTDNLSETWPSIAWPQKVLLSKLVWLLDARIAERPAERHTNPGSKGATAWPRTPTIG